MIKSDGMIISSPVGVLSRPIVIS